MIAESLSTIRNGGYEVLDNSTGAPRPARFGDAAILLRSLSNVHIYERALREAGIPYTLVAGAGFYERQEVIDFRNILAYLVDPCDELTLAAFLRGPIVGLSDNTLVELAGGIGAPRGVLHGFTSNVALKDSTQNARLACARDLIQLLNKERERPLSEFIQIVFGAIGLEGVVLRQFMGTQRVGNLRKIAALAETFSGAHPPSLRAFVRHLDDMAAREIREGEAAPDADDQHSVTIMTIHKAKGLEFPLVYVADLGRDAKGGQTKTAALHKDIGFAVKVIGPDGTLTAPALHKGIGDIRNDEELAEQARILYVAMTRARDHLFLCGAPSKASGNAWMSVFDEQFSICDKRDGDTFLGEGWEALVRRAVPRRSHAQSPPVSNDTPELGRIQSRIRNNQESIASRITIPVTDILRAMHSAQYVEAPTQRTGVSDSRSSRERGTLMHTFLERWDYRSAPDSALASVLRSATLDDAEARTFADDVSRIIALLRASALGRQIAEAGSIEREAPFLLNIDGCIVRGTIDLLIDRTIIIDYKTGRPKPEDLAAYTTQLQLYAAALRALTDVAAFSAHLVFLDSPDDFVRAVDVTEAAIERVLTNARAVLPSLAMS